MTSTTTTTACDYTVPATGRTTCSHSWACTSARIAAYAAGQRRDIAARRWRLGRATDAEFASAKAQEVAAWEAEKLARAQLEAHRAATGCCR